jgi:hypothetical protein
MPNGSARVKQLRSIGANYLDNSDILPLFLALATDCGEEAAASGGRLTTSL